MRSLTTAATGMLAQQINVDTIANNIANLNTTGFKRQRAEFQDLLYYTMEQMGVSSSDANTTVPTGVQVGHGVKTGSIYRITQQGNILPTGNRLDLAVSGEGYFTVQMPDGREGYTRAGNFSRNAEGTLVTEDGFTVAPGIVIPEEAVSVSINRSGEVSIQLADAAEPQVVGQLEFARFVNAAGLEAIGDNLFLATAASGPATLGQPASAGFGTLMQGFLETSNVDAVSEISNLITAQRAYEMNAKVITASDEMLSVTSQLR
jgi:flagellar basal-body rod protein FlgG